MKWPPTADGYMSETIEAKCSIRQHFTIISTVKGLGGTIRSVADGWAFTVDFRDGNAKHGRRRLLKDAKARCEALAKGASC